MKIVATVLGIFVATAAGDQLWAGQRPTPVDDWNTRTVTFRMIRGQPFVTAALETGSSADFALVAKGAPCSVRKELADQLWAGADPASAHPATLTIDDVILRNVPCRVGETNTIALARLGWSLTYDYGARQLVLRRARHLDEAARPTVSR